MSKNLAPVLFAVVTAACGGSSTPASTPAPASPAPAGDPAGPTAAAPLPAPPPPATGKPRNDLIPRTVLFGNPARVSVQISPDGKHLAWLAPKDGVMNVWVAPIGKLDQAKPVTNDTTRPVRSYSWAQTSNHVVYPQDVGGDENFHLFRASITNGEATDITPYAGARVELIGDSPKFPRKLIVQINDRDKDVFDVYELDVISGQRKLLSQNNDQLIGTTIDNSLRVRLGAKKLPDGSTQWLSFDGKQAWKPFETIAFEDADTTSMIGFAPGDKAIYAVDTRNRDTAALFSIDVATKKATLLAEDAKADADPGAMIQHPVTRAIQAISFEHARRRWHVLDKSIQADLDAIAQIEPGADFDLTSRTNDDKRWVVMTSSPKAPRRFHLWDRTTKNATFLFSARPEADKSPLVPMHAVEIKSRDGLSLVSYLTLPAAADPDGDGKANAPTPMVLFVHGGPWARDSFGYNTIHQLLANRGYAVLSVNYRGSTGFGKKFMNAANLQWGKAMHDDLIDAVKWAADQKVAPANQICILGGSYGGYATLVGMAMTPDVFACGVDLVGVSNLHTFIASIPSYWRPMMALLKKRVGDPDTAEGKALLTASSPVTHAARIKRPLLIGQGANDPRVKEAESEQIVAAMKKHGLPVTYALFPDEGHGFARPVNNIAFFAIAEAFLSAHLGGSYLPITQEELSASSMKIVDGATGIPGLPAQRK